MRIMKQIKPIKIKSENIGLLQKNLIRNDQFDRKIREIEIRTRNLKKREERERIWRGDKVNSGIRVSRRNVQKSKGETLNMLLGNKVDTLKKTVKKKKSKRKSKKPNDSMTSLITGPVFGNTIQTVSRNSNSNCNSNLLNEKTIEADINYLKYKERIPVILQNRPSGEVFCVFGCQSEKVIKEMNLKLMNSQSIINNHIEILESIIKGSEKEKYLEETQKAGGFIVDVLFKEQKKKYKRQRILRKIEMDLGLEKLFNLLKDQESKTDEPNIDLLNLDKFLENQNDFSSEGILKFYDMLIIFF